MEHIESLRSEIAEYRFLVELDDLVRHLVDPAEITLAAATFLGQHLGANRCAYADVEADQTTFNLTGNYTNGVPTIVGRYDISAFGAEYVRLCHSGVPYVVEDAETDDRVAQVRDVYRQLQIRSVVSIPIIKAGKFVAGMAVHQVSSRQWQAAEIRLISMVANRCWESIERNRITRELHESEAKFRTITNAMPQLVWTARPDGFVDYHNDQLFDYAGVPRGSTSGDAWADLIHPEDQKQAFEAWSHSVANGVPYETTYRVRHHSGEYRWTLARGLPVRDGSGNIIKWMGTNTDIQAQKRAEELLREANHRKDEFLAMLAHELRNPLAPISAAADLLSMTKAADAQVQKTADIIRRQVDHLSSLVTDLLDVARVTRGTIQLESALFDVKQVVADAAEQVRPLVEQHKHHLVMHLAPEAVFVMGDQKRLVQVLTNLLDNAAKYTPAGGNITLRMAASQSEVILSVSDDGLGMKPDLLQNVFDLFQQGERTVERSQGGLGIGLALVKSLVEQHHGTVIAKSAGPSQGSEFVVRLPRVYKAEEPVGMARPTPQPPSRKLRILVVDDNMDAAESTATLLKMMGNEVAVEFEPGAALARVQREKFDAYVLDIGLPGMDGYELVQRLRSCQGMEKAVFAAVTGYGQEQDRQKSAAAGFDHHFVKPVNIHALTEVFKVLH
ncbi:PAS/PAC sensor hybrid histidine kinase [Noviherbaspirillum humi]|uniref:histidine kinase n=1 Tax=Noviherbaspirillum humi TaxID=1688639 RepID=A0A239LCV3_9BURK|nr:ATP-binding protein [Noviherbaspirillum humi]SNT28486.1 PAS/PAC sensor hybrid histidine kinase [Noviherbaspirillum humi]